MPEVAELNRQIESAKSKYEQAQRLSRSTTDPSVKRNLEKATSLINKRNDLFRKREASIVARLEDAGGRNQEGGRSLRDLREMVEAKKVSVENYRKLLDEVEVADDQQGGDQVKMDLIKEDLEGFKTMYEAVERRLEQLRYESRGETRISKVADGRPNGVPFVDNRTKYLLITPVGGARTGARAVRDARDQDRPGLGPRRAVQAGARRGLRGAAPAGPAARARASAGRASARPGSRSSSRASTTCGWRSATSRRPAASAAA